MLMASCETTRAFASMLNVVTDRMAVLCTSNSNENSSIDANNTTTWPLSRVRTTKLKRVLDGLSGSKERMCSSSWENAIGAAADMLLQSPVLDLETEIVQDTFGMVIVLTAAGANIPRQSMVHESLQFHVVCPLNVPQSKFGMIQCNGWKIRSATTNLPCIVKTTRNIETNSLVRKLHDLIQHARSGRCAGNLSFLSLDLKAASNCSVQEVMGQTDFMTLQPGEEHTVLVKVKMNGSLDRNGLLRRAVTMPEMGQDSIEILDKLDEMLCLSPKPMKILSARLRYKHSLLPRNTMCDTHGDCRVNRASSLAADEMQSGGLPSSELPAWTALVHERLAYHLATNGSPKHALSTFREEFGEDGWHSFCPEYTRSLLVELKYQARIIERLEMNASPQKPIQPFDMVMDCPRNSSQQQGDRDASSSESLKPLEWLTDVHEGKEPVYAAPDADSIVEPPSYESTKSLEGFKLRRMDRSVSSRQARVISTERSMGTVAVRSVSSLERR